ncbi:MAG: guanylate kinase [Roseburia sp.]|nr:guanylate kinase [Roseburia sp.]
MSRIYYMMGKSSTGKDTLYKRIFAKEELQLKTVIPYTTRPIREGEKEGVEYFFCDAKRVTELEEAGKVIERRDYNTIHGIWTYFTVDDGQIDLENQDYLIIGTLESYHKMRDYYGKEVLVPIYIEVEDGERLQRALNREKEQAVPKYEEMCRRFLADAKDFSEENLQNAEISKRFINRNLNEIEDEIVSYIQSFMCNK